MVFIPPCIKNDKHLFDQMNVLDVPRCKKQATEQMTIYRKLIFEIPSTA